MEKESHVTEHSRETGVVVIDCECTTFQRGNPFARKNKLVVLGVKDLSYGTSFYWYPNNHKKILEDKKLLIGFNIKFDLNWLQREGIYDPSRSYRIWDCQLVHFIQTNQKHPYPSLNDVADYYGLPNKLDAVKKLWEQGIDTTEIEPTLLTEYLQQDLDLTYQIYLKQLANLKDNQKNLISLANQDLVVLQQMEYNGLYYNADASRKAFIQTTKEIKELEDELATGFEVQHPINWNSHDEISVLLYGGTIEFIQRIQFGTYKSGIKAGQPRFKNVPYPVSYPRLVEPAKNTELKKEGYWKTDTETFKKLKPNKKVKHLIDLLLLRSEKEKLASTYQKALPELIEKMDWKPNMIHGNFNQCVAVTGRLSSSKPNLQNQSADAKQFFETRYI